MRLLFTLLWYKIFPKKDIATVCTPCGIAKTVHYDKTRNEKNKLIR
jgi:hypothetical protein